MRVQGRFALRGSPCAWESAKVVRHARQVIFQMAEVAVPRELFRAILEKIESLRMPAMASG